MKQPLYPLLLILFMAYAFVTTCRKQGDEAHIPRGGTLSIGLPGSAGDLFPLTITSYDLQEISNHLLNPTLTYLDADGEAQPGPVRGWQYDPENKRLVYFLENNRRWSDGSRLTAADIFYTWRFIRQYADSMNPVWQPEAIDTCYIQDSLTVVFQFIRPVIRPVRYTRFPILPQRVTRAPNWRKAREAYEHSFKGLGPFVLSQHDARHLVLHKHPYSTASIDTVLISFYQDETRLKNALRAGRYDLAPDVSPGIYNTFKKDRRYNSHITVERGFTFIAWNLRAPLIRKRLVREALSRAIDRPTIVDGVLGNLGIVHDAPAYPSFRAYLDTVAYPFNPDTAMSMLKHVRFKKPLRLLVNRENAVRGALARNIQNYWQAAGIPVKIIALDWDAFLKALHTGRFDAALIAWATNDYYNPGDLFLSVSVKKANNFMHYQNNTADNLLNRALTSPQQAGQKSLWVQFQRQIIRDLPITILFSKRIATLSGNNLHNVTIDDAGYLHHPELWYKERP